MRVISHYSYLQTNGYCNIAFSCFPRVHSASPDSYGCVVLPGCWSVVLPGVCVLPAVPQALAGVCRHPPHHSQPPQLQGQHHTKEWEIHTHGVQGQCWHPGHTFLFVTLFYAMKSVSRTIVFVVVYHVATLNLTHIRCTPLGKKNKRTNPKMAKR